MGVAYLPSKHWLYAINKGTGTRAGNVVLFDASTRQIVTRIPLETSPYQAVLSRDVIARIENLEEALSVPQLALILGCSEKLLYAQIATGRIPSFRVG